MSLPIQRRGLLGTIVAVALLAGCAQRGGPQPAGMSASTGRLSGRFSLQLAGTQAGDRAQGANAGFELQGDARAGELELTSPLGSTVALVRWSPGRAWLQTAEQQRDFPDLGSLTRELMGEDIPVQALFDWLQGRPYELAPYQRYADGFEQLGWQVELRRFAGGLLVARRLNPAGAEPLAVLRLALDRP